MEIDVDEEKSPESIDPLTERPILPQHPDIVLKPAETMSVNKFFKTK